MVYMVKIIIWSDFACPYCYIGEARLKKAIDELGVKDNVQVDYRAFELNPGASKEAAMPMPELIAKRYQVSLDVAKQQI